MSTVPEVNHAVHTGMRVLGVSIITDQCLPDALAPASVEQIIAVGTGRGAPRSPPGGRRAGAPQLWPPLFDSKLSADALEKQLPRRGSTSPCFQKTQEAPRYGPPFVFTKAADGQRAPGIHHVFARTDQGSGVPLTTRCWGRA